MSKYPNIDAVLEGRVSGHATEWPLLRKELISLLSALEPIVAVAKKWGYINYKGGRPFVNAVDNEGFAADAMQAIQECMKRMEGGDDKGE